MRRSVAAVAVAAVLAVATPVRATPRHVVVEDGFTATGYAGAQAVVHLAHPTPPPGPIGSGPPTDLKTSAGPIAGFALMAVKGGAYAVVVQTTNAYMCGQADCGEDTYPRDATASTSRLPAGDYVLVLLGAPGAKVTVTLRPSTRTRHPVRVPLPSRATPDVRSTGSATGQVAGAQPFDRGMFRRSQGARHALVGVVHTFAIQYGSSIDYTLCAGRTATTGECGGTHRVGSQDLYNNDPATMPLHMAVTPMYATHALLVPSDAVEADVGGSWEATVYGAQAHQQGLGVYVPLVAT